MKIGDAVEVPCNLAAHRGVICGTATAIHNGEIQQGLLVKLYEGFHDPIGGWISVLVVHPDNLRLI